MSISARAELSAFIAASVCLMRASVCRALAVFTLFLLENRGIEPPMRKPLLASRPSVLRR